MKTQGLTGSAACITAGLVAILASSSHLAAQVSLTSRPALGASNIPASAAENGRFELGAVGPGTFLRNPTWGAWQFDVFSGIAHETSVLASGNPPLPSGDRVAYIAAQGRVAVNVTPAAGVYRLRYLAAARTQGGVPDAQTLSVRVNGVQLAYQDTLGSSYDPYTSRPFVVAAGGTAQIEFVGGSASPDVALLENVVLEPLRRWSDASSWVPAIAPQAGDTVLVRARSAIALETGCAAGAVTVKGSLLAPEASSDLTASSVLVTGSRGRLEVGRREAPLSAAHTFTLTLTGSFQSTNSKFLMVSMGGIADLHGAPKRSWTTMTQTADDGDFSIEVANAEGWQVGDQIVIAGSEGQGLPGIASSGTLGNGTSYAFRSFAERFSINSITANIPPNNSPPNNITSYTVHLGMRVAWPFTDTLLERHISSSRSYPTSGPARWDVEQHAEVGMLTHNVKVTSVPTIVPGTSNAPETGFGGHIMIMGDLANNVGVGRFSSVELTKMGQTKQLGRYPIHWHMCRDNAAGQYIIDSSVHETFHRAVTVHGTDGILVENVVAFRNLGHAFFLEDGSEQDNVFHRNLAIETMKPLPGDEFLISDNEFDAFQNRTPAAYWITNPNNTFTENVACDTVGTGFWFALPSSVLGLSHPNTPNAIPHNFNDEPNRMDLDVFRGNIAHGCRQGFDVHDGIKPDDSIETNLTWRPASGVARIEDFLAYSCDSGIYAGNGDQDEVVVFDNARIVDNRIGVRLASHDMMEDCLFVADTGNGLYATLPVAAVGKRHEAYRIYDGAASLFDSHFDGFHVAGKSRLFHSNGASLRRTNHTLSGSTFEPAVHVTKPRIVFDDFSQMSGGGTGLPIAQGGAQDPADPRSWGFSVWDATGDLTGAIGSIIGNHPWMQDGTEVSYDNAGGGSASRAFFTPRRFGHLFIREPGVAGPGLPEITFTRLKSGTTPVSFQNGYIIDQQKQVPVIVNADYLYDLQWTDPANGVPTSGSPKMLLRVGNMAADDVVLLRLQIQQPTVQVSLDGTAIASTANLADLQFAPPGAGPLMYVDTTGSLFLRYMNVPAPLSLQIDW